MALGLAQGLAQSRSLTWNQAQHQPADWYASAEAVRIADNLLFYQRAIGGWPKNIDMAAPLSPAGQAELIDQKEQNDSLIDNGATYSQMIYLARVYQATPHERFKQAFLRGLDYLLKMQYANGGWPQFYPLRKGYYSHITYNDNAMVNVLRLLQDVVRKKNNYLFVDDAHRQRAEQAIAKGVECILKTQIVVNGQRTVWCAQHDEVTLAPANARTYEKISLSGLESVGIVRFLMSLERPNKEVTEAIEAAVAWFRRAKLTGIRVLETSDSSLPKGRDRVVVKDDNADPLWARFYEISTNRPIFCGRDGIIKYSLAEIEYERRNGYGWYTDAPAALLDNEYPSWKTKQR